MKILTAKYGYIIRVDFRDIFKIEPSEDCKNDYLEIRDGAHGYADLLGTYCGDNFPPMITSKDRFLWLRFHSDESLEYHGFKGVYYFIENTRKYSYDYLLINIKNLTILIIP